MKTNTPTKRSPPRKVNFFDSGSADEKVVLMTSYGVTAQATARKTGLTVGQVRYRLSKTQGVVSAMAWRNARLPSFDRKVREVERDLRYCDTALRQLQKMSKLTPYKAR